MLNLSRLQLLHELSVLGTISAVARATNLTRSAVSQQLSQLEREVGTVLFERSSKGVRWTAAGERLIERVRVLLQAVDEIETELACSMQDVAGELRVASFGSAAATIIPHAMSQLLREYPALKVVFVEMEPLEGLKAVATKQVDVAIVDDLTNPDPYSSQLDFQALYVDAFRVVLSVDHALASRSPNALELKNLAHERWALNHAAVTYQSFIANACHAEGYSPQIVASSRNIGAILEFVRSGDCITVLPGLATQHIRNDPDFRCLSLSPALIRHLSAATAKGGLARPVIKAAIRAFEKACQLY